MDTRQMRYLIEIAEAGSINKAAEKLFISQSGLNQQLIRMEKELGATLFLRTTHSLKLTEAGSVVLSYAREMVKREEAMRMQVEDVLDGSVGSVRVNLAMDFGIELFCACFPLFHEKYPKISLELQDHIVYEQYDRLLKGKLDIGMVMIKTREIEEIAYVHLAYERFLLGVPADHFLSKYYLPTEDGDYHILDLSACRDYPFSLMFQGSTMRQVIDPYFEAAGYKPQVLFACRTNHVAAMMVSHGICLTILPESQIKSHPDIRWFRIPGEPTWESCMIYHKDKPPRKAGWYFIELAQEKAKELMKPTRPDMVRLSEK